MFDLDELIQSDVADRNLLKEQYIIPASVVNQLANLCLYVLDRVKENFPNMKINSGYRCRTLNAWVKGSKNSQHMKGQAADISHSNLDAVWQLLKDINVDQCIRYDNFIHVSFKFMDNRNQYIDQRSQNH